LTQSALPCYDIYCRVVDNFGDIGVSWRLARQLISENLAREVRLHVDDLNTFARIAPGLRTGSEPQVLNGVTILPWRESPPPTAPDVVIEAFACDPPSACVSNMTAETLWLNLEYLSAEQWVEGCHGLPSLRADGRQKFFFFPGFTPDTGGLLRETGLLNRRIAWQADPVCRDTLLARIGVSADARASLQQGTRLVFLFCYPHAPVAALLAGLAAAGQTLLLAPEGLHPTLRDARPSGVRVQEIPYVDQDDFDRLLWSADLNFVRGEDSLIRALWAGRPMVWQPYLQADDAHLDKLSAWLMRSTPPPAIHALHQAWNGVGPQSALPNLVSGALSDPVWSQWSADCFHWSAALAQQTDLAHRLAAFVHHQRQKSASALQGR